ncbi:hypothetical protein LIA77_09187 [Sarocladium implicatum]|nr:hypothetical protein LIA77_09187 [Sarocladium implicatum]
MGRGWNYLPRAPGPGRGSRVSAVVAILKGSLKTFANQERHVSFAMSSSRSLQGRTVASPMELPESGDPATQLHARAPRFESECSTSERLHSASPRMVPGSHVPLEVIHRVTQAVSETFFILAEVDHMDI